MAINNLLDIIIKENQEQAAALKAEREQLERNYCILCGKEITEYEETELTNDYLTLTYRCSCGCYAEQVYALTYQGTQEV